MSRARPGWSQELPLALPCAWREPRHWDHPPLHCFSQLHYYGAGLEVGLVCLWDAGAACVGFPTSLPHPPLVDLFANEVYWLFFFLKYFKFKPHLPVIFSGWRTVVEAEMSKESGFTCWESWPNWYPTNIHWITLAGSLNTGNS